ncbi:MAG: carbon storage regulator [Chloroflexi bacterium]|nr:carbon storage regulator [Chloroflexota bacterium]
MLVLTRRPDESLSINSGEIIITVLGVEGDRVKLGISAPRHVSILRQELCEEVREQNRVSALPVQASGQLAAVVRGLVATQPVP